MKFAKFMMAAAVAVGAIFTTVGCGKKGNEKEEMRQSAVNLKQIGLACMMFTGDNSEKFPKNLSAIPIQNYITDPFTFVSPLDKKRKPADFTKFPKNNDPAAAAFSFPNENLSYAYIGNGLKENSSADLPVAFEKPDLVKNGWINVLCVNGTVKRVKLTKNKNPKTCLEILNQMPGLNSKDKDYAILLENAIEIDKAGGK